MLDDTLHFHVLLQEWTASDGVHFLAALGVQCNYLSCLWIDDFFIVESERFFSFLELEVKRENQVGFFLD